MSNGFYTNVARYANSILYRGYDDDGKRVSKRVYYKPTMYLPAKEETPSSWHTLKGDAVEPMVFGSMREVKEFKSTYKGFDEYELSGNEKHITAFIQSLYPRKIEFVPENIDIGYFDIECPSEEGFPEPSAANAPIVTIAYKSSRRDEYYVWGLGPYDPAKTKTGLNVKYFQFLTEDALLADFLEFFSDSDSCPDILSGWNIRFFDVPYLINRINRVLGDNAANALSPWKKISARDVNIFDVPHQTYDISGVEQLDYLELFKKFGYKYGPQESYKLNAIATVILGRKKVDYQDVGTLSKLYVDDHQRFVDYNIVDVELVSLFEEKVGMINLVQTLAYFAGVNYTDTLGTVGIWDSIIFRYLAQKKIAIPPAKVEERSAFAGGFVKPVIPDMYNWVMSFDFASLYPNIIIQNNMSPETLIPHTRVEGLSPKIILRDKTLPKEEDVAVACNGVCFSRDKQGFLPTIIEELYDKRVIIKNKMLGAQQEKEDLQDPIAKERVEGRIAKLETEQMAIKILLNSLYGAMGNIYFRYFDLRIAEGVTLTGQTVVQWGELALNKWLNDLLKTDSDYVIAIDTDSVYLNVEAVVDKFKPADPVKFLDKFANDGITPVLKKSFKEFADLTCAFKERMDMKREVIADRGIWTAKKRYILNVHNSEGVQYKTPKLKIMGLEAVKSSTPEVCRDALRKMFGIIIGTDEATTQAAIEEFRKEFDQFEPEKIAFPRGTTNIISHANRNTIYDKGTPIHVRGSLLYNHQLKKQKLEHKYPLIRGGDKVRFLYLKVPNPIRENTIAFVDKLPKELGLHEYVDYDLQFEKTFIKPFKIIMDAIKWNIKPVANLEAFFG